MKEVLISIKPQWVEKICKKIGEENGKPIYEKRIDVRKTRPKIETPFKCYIYCTKDNDLWLTQKGIKRKTELSGYLLNGKVIGEFICDKIYKIKNYRSSFVVNNDIRLTERIARASCLYVDEMQKYLGEKDGYGWHISDLVIYDKPKELYKFKTFCKSYYDGDRCEDCKYFIDGRCYEYDESDCGCNGLKPIERAPQSWCYVESLGE